MAIADSTRGRTVLTAALVAAAVVAGALWMYLRREEPAPPPPVDVALPSDFGDTVKAASLIQLLTASAGGAMNHMSLGLDLGRRDGPQSLRIGDSLRVVASAGEPARCALFHRNASGHVRLFHPRTGESFALAAAENWDSGPLRVTEPAGPEVFLLVCRSAGAPEFDLAEVLQRPRTEWHGVLSAVRGDYLVRP